MKTNKHLTQKERYTIERMGKEGYNQARIAERSGATVVSAATATNKHRVKLRFGVSLVDAG